LRLALHILKKDEAFSEELSEAILNLRTQTTYCKTCFSISDAEQCKICSSVNRDHSVICVVEEITDVLALENTGQFSGVYHLLGGKISPLEGIGPSDLNIEQLLSRAKNDEVQEVILALSPTMEGDTTAFYLSKKLAEFNVKLSTIARGIPVGGELEYTDEVTLGRSIQSRIAYK